MKHIFKVIVISLFVCLATSAYGKAKQTQVYVFGLAAAFNDSTVYITDIQTIPNAWIDQRTNFLMSRQEYSYQLRDYLASIGIPHMTCITFYSNKKKDIEKKLASVLKRYNKKSHRYLVKQITLDSFTYKVQDFDANEEQLMSRNIQQKKSKQERKAKQEVQKEAKKNAPKNKKKAFKARQEQPSGTLF